MAVTANTVWEVRTTGSDVNGGGFDPTVAGAGTDYSLLSVINITTLTTAAANATTITATNSPFTPAMVGNVIQITAGTQFTVGGFFVITGYTNANNVVLNTSPTPSAAGSGGSGQIGGALATLTKPAVVAGNKVYVYGGGGAFNITASQIHSVAGTNTAPIDYIGYQATRGDNGLVTVTRTSGSGILVMSITGSYRRFYNFIANCAAGTTSTGFSITGATQAELYNCQATNFTTAGFAASSTARVHLLFCDATGGSSAATAAFNVTANVANTMFGCSARNNACPGFIWSGVGSTSIVQNVIHCLSSGNTGASSDGFRMSGNMGLLIMNCVAHGNGANGLSIDNSTTAAAGEMMVVVNSIFSGHSAGFGIKMNPNAVLMLAVRNNAFYNNNSGHRSNFPVGVGDVALTVDPFTNAAGGDFTLNNTAGGGASCRGDGTPGAMFSGGTGYIDIGALQHLDAGGGGGGGGSYTFIGG